MPSYDFAIRIQPISGVQFLHSGYVRNGEQFDEIPFKTCQYLNFSDHPDFSNEYRDLCDLIRPDAGDVVSPWNLHPHAQSHVAGYHGQWTNIDEVEHRFAELAEPGRRSRLEVSRRNGNAKILEWYGRWIFDALLLGGRNDISARYDTCRNAALADQNGVFRVLLEISIPADHAECEEAKSRRDELSSLTFELLIPSGERLLADPCCTLYRVEKIDAFDKEESTAARCKAPRAFIGVAGPDDRNTGLPTLSLYEWFTQLEDIVSRPDRRRAQDNGQFILPGTLDMQLSKPTIDGNGNVGQNELVTIIAHGIQPVRGGPRELVLNSGYVNQPTLEALVPVAAVGRFLTRCNARLAIIACCQGRNPGAVNFDDLGAQLFQASTSRLAAIVCFRAEVAVRTVAAFMKGIAEKLEEANPDNPFQLMQALAYAQHKITVTADQFDAANRLWDYAIPAFYVRQELELHIPKPPAERWVILGEAGGVVREIAMYPMTREEFREFLVARAGNPPDPWANNANRDDDDLPATGLTWEIIQEFIGWKNADQNNDGWHYYLPCPVEWIEAAQGPWDLPEASTAGSLVSVFETSPNGSGVFGMLGNCWEITASDTPQQNPLQLRGGDCSTEPEECNNHHCLKTSIEDIDAQAAANRIQQPRLEIGFRLARWQAISQG